MKSIILQKCLGFDYPKAQLLAAPPYIFSVIMSLIMAWISDKYRIRWQILCFQVMSAVAELLVLMYSIEQPYVQYFGSFLAALGTQGNVPGILAYGQNQTRKIEKRGIASSVMISVGAAGGVRGSIIFCSQGPPRYMLGMWATIGMILLYIIVTFLMSMYFKRENRFADEGKRPALEGVEGVEGFKYAV